MPRKKPQIFPNPTAFSLNGIKPQAAVRREISTRSQLNSLENTIIYGEDDALPLRITKLTSESPAALACINTTAKYIKGSGFSNKDLMRLKVDKNGTTLWQFHTQLCQWIAQLSGYSVNFKFDASGKITNSYILPFEGVRLVKPDDTGHISMVKYNPYFGTQEFKKEYTTEYHTFDKNQVLNQMEDEGNKFVIPLQKPIELGDGDIIITDDKSFIKFNFKSGEIEVSADMITFNIKSSFAINSATLTHNGINVGDTHTHTQGNDSANNTQVATNPPS